MKAARRRDIRCSCLLSVLGAGVCIWLCLLGKDCDEPWLHRITVVLSTLLGWIVLYRLCNHIRPMGNRIQFEKGLLCAVTNEFHGTVVQVEQPMTMRRHIQCLPLKLQQEDGCVALYWDAKIPMPDLTEKKVQFIAVCHQIVAYEVEP